MSIILRGFSTNSKITDYAYIITTVAMIMLVLTSLNKKEEVDEMSRVILGKVNDKCIKFIIIITIGFSYFAQSDLTFTSSQVYAVLTTMIFIIMFLRAVLFSYYDKKGDLN